MMAVTRAPDCEMKARSPGLGARWAKLALSPSAGNQQPDAVRPLDAQAVGPRRVKSGLAKLARRHRQ